MMNVKPSFENNAIQQAAFAVQFQHFFDEDVIRGLKEKIDAGIGQSFNTSNFSKSVGFEFNADIGEASTTSGLDGFTYNQSKNNKILWQILLQGPNLVVVCSEYTRWAEVSAKAMKWIVEILGIIESLSRNNRVAEISFQCSDSFDVINEESFSFNNLFKADNKYLTSSVVSLSKYWHINQGWFIEFDPLNVQSLVNLNIASSLINHDSDKMRFIINHLVKLNILTIDNLDLNSVMTDFFEWAHIKNKDIIEDLISDSLLKEIGFNKNANVRN